MQCLSALRLSSFLICIHYIFYPILRRFLQDAASIIQKPYPFQHLLQACDAPQACHGRRLKRFLFFSLLTLCLPAAKCSFQDETWTFSCPLLTTACICGTLQTAKSIFFP